MDISTLKTEYIGKELLVIIDLNLDDECIVSALNQITGITDSYPSIETAKVLLFEKNKALVFIDFDGDGYRSGNWHLIQIKTLLDKHQTTGLKKINSIIRNIEYFDNIPSIPYTHSRDTECIIITTDKYVIRMGQDSSDAYYPCNFFDLQECKDVALGILDYEEITRR